jgi:hypothetical protein
MGHNFERHAWHRAKGYCEKCNGVIIAVVQPWCQCTRKSHATHFSAHLLSCSYFTLEREVCWQINLNNKSIVLGVCAFV